MQRILASLLAALVAVVLAACSGATQDLGAGTSTGELDSPCSCGLADSCCASGLICDDCKVKDLTRGGGGFQTECAVGRTFCRNLRPEGAPCTTSYQCEQGADCLATASGDGSRTCTIPSAGVLPPSAPGPGPGRCRESLDCPANNVCRDSTCKLGPGAYCTKSSECASNVCYVAEGCR